MKIGVLLPQSNENATIGKEFMEGVRSGLKDVGADFFIEGIGLGSDPKQVMDAMQKLALSNGPDIIIGLLGHRGLQEVLNLAENLEIPLLYADFGASLGNKLKRNNFTYCVSYGLSQSAYMTGKRLVNLGKKNVLRSTCYYDAGYSFNMAFEKGLYENGGAFAGHFVTPLTPRENEGELIAEFVENTPCDAVYSVHSGLYAKEHGQFVADNEIYGELMHFTNPFALELKVRSQYQEPFNEVRSIATWLPKDNNEEISSITMLLGNEIGLILNETKDSNSICEAISSVSIESPRGQLSFSSLNLILSNCYEFTLKRDKESWYLDKSTIFDFDSEDEIAEKLNDLQDNGGWFNAYLCN